MVFRIAILCILSCVATPAYATDNTTTSLLNTASAGNLAAAQFALAHGANVNARDKHGLTALLIAAANGDAQIVRLL